MVDISNIDAVKRWLDAIQPVARRHDAAVAIAARAALRVLLLVSRELNNLGHDDARTIAEVVAPCFRSTALAWAIGKYPVYRKFADPQGDSHEAAYHAYTLSSHSSSAAAAADAAAAACATDAAEATNYAANATAQAVTHPDAPFDEAFDSHRSNFASAEDDFNWIDSKGSTVELAGRPLWLEAVPELTRDAWRDLKAALLAQGEDWEVWTDWYDARLAGDEGRPPNEALEIARATIADAIWRQGPKVVNAEINRLIAEHVTILALPSPDSIPPQSRSGTRFGSDDRGRLDLVGEAVSSDDLQRLHYEEMCYKAKALADLGQMLGDLAEPSQRLMDALPARIEELFVDKLWSRANTLRGRNLAHAQVSSDLRDPHPARLDILVAAKVADFVESYNVFALGEPRALELDAIRLGPREREEADRVVALAEPIASSAASASEVVTPAARLILTEQVLAAASASKDIHGNHASSLARGTAMNFVGELLRRAYAGAPKQLKDEATFASKEFRGGAYKTAGGGAIAIVGAAAWTYWPAFSSFIVQNAEALKAFATEAFHNPKVSQIIDFIVRQATGS